MPTEALDRGPDEASWIDRLEDEEELAADRRVEGKQLGGALHRALDGLRADYREVLGAALH